MFPPGIPGRRRERALGQAQRDSGYTRLLPSGHRRKFSDPPPHPRGVKFTRMIQHQLIILQPGLLLSPSAHLEAVEITPPEPVTLFNDVSGQNVTSLYEKAWGGCFKPQARDGCVLAFI